MIRVTASSLFRGSYPSSSFRSWRCEPSCIFTETVLPGSYSTAMFSYEGMKDSSWIGSSWSFMYEYDLVEPSWSLKVTQGEMTSSTAVPACTVAALSIADSCFLSPEKLRPTKVAPSWIARRQVSIAGSWFTTPDFEVEPASAVALNWPLVRPYTPLSSMMYTSGRFRRTRWTNCPTPMEAVSPSPETPRPIRVRLAISAPVATDGMRPWTALKACARLMKYAGV